jgi:hypothetical protein
MENKVTEIARDVYKRVSSFEFRVSSLFDRPVIRRSQVDTGDRIPDRPGAARGQDHAAPRRSRGSRRPVPCAMRRALRASLHQTERAGRVVKSRTR